MFLLWPPTVGSRVIDADTVKAMSALLLLVKWHSLWFKVALLVSMCQRWRDFVLEASPSAGHVLSARRFAWKFCTLEWLIAWTSSLVYFEDFIHPWHEAAIEQLQNYISRVWATCKNALITLDFLISYSYFVCHLSYSSRWLLWLFKWLFIKNYRFNHCLSVYIFSSELVCHKIVKCNMMWIQFI